MSQWSAELDRIEARLQNLSLELERLSRRFTQHEQALLELSAARNGKGEDVSPKKGTRRSVKR
jgi:prefoldin subunit 5